MKIFVTVGMSQWPFDRLMQAVSMVTADHDVFVQSGMSQYPLSCESRDFIGYSEVLENIKEADLVICHAGNSVRLVQRVNKLPIAMARQKDFGEMKNNHQVDYLRFEEQRNLVLGLWEIHHLPYLIAKHHDEQSAFQERFKSIELQQESNIQTVMGEICKKYLV